MKIYLATPSLEDVHWAQSCGVADGFLVAPSMFDADAGDAAVRLRAAEIARLYPCPVLVAAASYDAEALYRESRECARLSDQLILEFPCSTDTIEQLHRSVSDGGKVAASMIFTAAQALVAAKAGAIAVLVHVNALEAQGQHAGQTLREMRAIFDLQRMECDIVAVTPASAGQIGVCAAAGVDAVVLEVSVLRDVLLHPLADRTLDALLSGAPGTRSRSAT